MKKIAKADFPTLREVQFHFPETKESDWILEPTWNWHMGAWVNRKRHLVIRYRHTFDNKRKYLVQTNLETGLTKPVSISR